MKKGFWKATFNHMKVESVLEGRDKCWKGVTRRRSSCGWTSALDGIEKEIVNSYDC